MLTLANRCFLSCPLSDMKRYHKLLAGASWMAEYGNPDTDDWDYLQKYSPYHSTYCIISCHMLHIITLYILVSLTPVPYSLSTRY